MVKKLERCSIKLLAKEVNGIRNIVRQETFLAENESAIMRVAIRRLKDACLKGAKQQSRIKK